MSDAQQVRAYISQFYNMFDDTPWVFYKGWIYAKIKGDFVKTQDLCNWAIIGESCYLEVKQKIGDEQKQLR